MIETLESIIIIKFKDRECNPNNTVDHNSVSKETLGNVNFIHSPTKVNNTKSKSDKVSSSDPNVSNFKSKIPLNNIRMTRTKVINNSNHIEANNI